MTPRSRERRSNRTYLNSNRNIGRRIAIISRSRAYDRVRRRVRRRLRVHGVPRLCNCSIGDPRGCDDPVESAGTARPRLASDGNGCAFRSTSSSARSLGFVPRRRGFTVACHGECQRSPELVAVRFGFGMFPSLETNGTIPNHQVRAGLFVRGNSPAIGREQRKRARCNRN